MANAQPPHKHGPNGHGVNRHAAPGRSALPADERLTARQLREIFDTSFVYSCLMTPAGVVLDVNRAALKSGGLSPEDVIGQPLWSTYPLAHSAVVRQQVRAAVLRAASGATVRDEIEVRLAQGRMGHVAATFTPFHDAAGAVAGIAVSALDVTERRQTEHAMRALIRTLRMVTECSELLLSCGDEAKLLADLCRTIVDTGNYRFAWLGVAEHDAARSVRQLASAGAGRNYLEKTRISWSDGPHGQGPTGRALRKRATIVWRDTDADVDYAPWRETAAEYGFVCSVAIPVAVGDERLAVLNIYSADSGAFGREELELLGHLAGSLGCRLRAHEAARAGLQNGVTSGAL